MLEMDDFAPLGLDARHLFMAHHARYPPVHSENMFTTLVSWSHYIEPMYMVSGDNLAVATRSPDGIWRFRPPSGPRNDALVRDLVALAEALNNEYLLVLVDNDTREYLARLFPGMEFVKHRDFFDYVYLADDLAGLRGGKYQKHRSKINRFRKRYECSVELLSPDNLDEARSFLRRWCLWKDCESDPLLDNERIAVQFMMENFSALGLEGLAVRMGGSIEAVAVFEPMSPDTAVIHLEKAMPDFDGLYQVINQETARHLARRFKFINRQSDMGIEGLRTAKQRYHPHHMVEVQHMIRPGTGHAPGPEIY